MKRFEEYEKVFGSEYKKLKSYTNNITNIKYIFEEVYHKIDAAIQAGGILGAMNLLEISIRKYDLESNLLTSFSTGDISVLKKFLSSIIPNNNEIYKNYLKIFHQKLIAEKVTVRKTIIKFILRLIHIVKNYYGRTCTRTRLYT